MLVVVSFVGKTDGLEILRKVRILQTLLILAVTEELESSARSSSCMAGTTNSIVEFMAHSKAMALVAYRCQPWHLPVFVDWFGGPLGVRIPSDSFMGWINVYNLKESVCGIFTNPVRLQDTQSPTLVSSSLLGNILKAPSKL
ncbi:hypothetical protein mRhiFer1_008757 [Rhinolophus ferrumequinum]|uniref:Uncharacterized protein n=1 Tax=Rhinolophus ferrumequinum TaxID=59479 RepID=A0A7J7TMT3_RHIFE|nr:hypothetical protein mRhiFer1_008757 [Rhinolophus ferrumequinum]